jgi:signal transduction histidine kinase/CheY-like chemotaxis protein
MDPANKELGMNSAWGGDDHGNAHIVQFYEDDEFLIGSLSDWFGEGLEAGHACIGIMTAGHMTALESRFVSMGLQPESLRKQGRLICLDAASTLAKLSVNGWPDQSLLAKEIEGSVAGLRDHAKVRAFGEMVALLWHERKWRAAIRLEEIWNEFLKLHSFSLCCAYPIRSVATEEELFGLCKVHEMHSMVIPAESYSALSSPAERLRSVTVLQHKAQLLEAEKVGRQAAEESRDQLEQQLRAKLDELAEADRRKDEFVAMLGHELRNPLAATFNAIVAAEIDESHREHALSIAHRQIDQLARLLDALLDVERITRGKIELKRDVLQVGNTLRDAIEAAQSEIDAQRHIWSVRITQPAEGALINADLTRLRQAISNLIHNASKFTPDGGSIDILVQVESSEVAIRMRDSGIGITPELLPHVFELFTQAERSLDRKYGGLGIGLTLVKRIVDMHGGRVTAKSAGPGKGSEFEIYLPLLAAARTEPGITEGTPVKPSSARILIVEDNADAAEALAMLLQRYGHPTTAVESGLDAIEAIRCGEFDFALVDIGLPEIDGYEVARRIRSMPNGARVKLVALTGYGQESDKKQAHVAGFDHHLTKPVNIGRLRSLLGSK